MELEDTKVVSIMLTSFRFQEKRLERFFPLMDIITKVFLLHSKIFLMGFEVQGKRCLSRMANIAPESGDHF